MTYARIPADQRVESLIATNQTPHQPASQSKVYGGYSLLDHLAQSANVYRIAVQQSDPEFS